MAVNMVDVMNDGYALNSDINLKARIPNDWIRARDPAADRKEARQTEWVVDDCTTIPRLFWKKVHERGDMIAIREKDYGIWKELSWSQYGKKVGAVGRSLLSLGIKHGDVVSILSENVPEWLFADMGSQCIGCISNGIYPTDSPSQVAYIIRDSSTRILFVEDDEQLDKVLKIRDQCPLLMVTVVFDMKGLRHLNDQAVMSFDDFLALGTGEKADDTAIEAASKRVGPRDIATLIYTSGTTGAPKGSMITHENWMYQMNQSDRFCPLGPKDEMLSFLPLCHVAERKFGMLFSIKTGAILNFVEGLDTVAENMREVAPTVFFAVPRFWEKFYSDVSLKTDESSWICKTSYGLAMSIAERTVDYKLKERPVPTPLRVAYWFADVLVFRNIKNYLGLRRAKVLCTGAAPIAPRLLRWYIALGFEMRELYGQTECTGVAAIMPSKKKLGTVGTPLPESEIKISADGEILIRGPHVFAGYLNNPEQTQATVIDGWLKTGDVGHIDEDGYLVITDRMKDIIITSGGKNITPSEIENLLKFSLYISDAVVVGDGKKYLTCLVMIDHENVVKYAQDNNIPFSNYASLCAATEIQELIKGEVEQVNQQVAGVETIKDFRLIDQLLTAEDEELTPTMKLKRKIVSKKYANLIDSMYLQ